MATYKLTNFGCVTRLDDGAIIPFADGNADYESYKKWIAEDNTPEPADTPPWSPDPLLSKVRAARDIAASRLDGIAGRMTRAGDTTGIAAACDAAIVAMLNITTIDSVKAATDDASLSAALLAEYERIVATAAAAAPDLVKAFAGFNL